ncbi:MAG TPA: putative peptidoglycan glycosyltransferase FtsW [Candidatus Paceibacterota bacterium]|jgi:cell division protein FtsW
MKASGDRVFAIIVLTLVVAGLALFSSASLGLLARADASPWKLLLTQFTLGLIPGFIALLAFRLMPQKRLLALVLPFYIASILLALAVFSPLGLELNGARRWINIGITTFQPAEFLKIGVVLMLAAFLAKAGPRIKDLREGLVPFCLIVGVPAVILLAQPNTSTVLIIGATCASMYFLAGAPWRDFLILGAVSVAALTVLVFMRPYLMARVQTFIDPSAAPQAAGYHIQQSLIAIGSGGLTGRGFGQSVQKFNYLPEAQSDSVFAVYGEEFGFVGTLLLVMLFVAFALRGLMIASSASSMFGLLVATGLTLLITFSAFLNIGALLGIAPLTGLPLPFISHGGTALMATLLSVGIILNIAANRKKRA